MAQLDTEFDLHEIVDEGKCWCCPDREDGYWWHNAFGLDLRGIRKG